MFWIALTALAAFVVMVVSVVAAVYVGGNARSERDALITLGLITLAVLAFIVLVTMGGVGIYAQFA